eukprot:COSAG05_NODE_3898_length_1782_cov_37.293523_2_plen_277_part_00
MALVGVDVANSKQVRGRATAVARGGSGSWEEVDVPSVEPAMPPAPTPVVPGKLKNGTVLLANLNARNSWDKDNPTDQLDVTTIQRYVGMSTDSVSASNLCVPGQACSVAAAIQQYLDDCNRSGGVDGDAYSTILMVWLLFLFTILEMFLLIKVGASAFVFKPQPQHGESAVVMPMRVIVALLLSWVYIVFTATDVYAQAIRLQEATDRWNTGPHSVAGLYCSSGTTNCLAEMCPDGSFELPARILSADDGGVHILNQVAFCWGMWTVRCGGQPAYN